MSRGFRYRATFHHNSDQPMRGQSDTGNRLWRTGLANGVFPYGRIGGELLAIFLARMLIAEGHAGVGGGEFFAEDLVVQRGILGQ